MAKLRLRHSKGTSAIEVDLENGTVQDLQNTIFAATQIVPSQQDLKAGYPPRTLEIISELPVASLGLQSGDQIIVTQTSSSRTAPAPISARSSALPTTPSAAQTARPATSSLAKNAYEQPDYVDTDAGVLIHRIVPDDNSCLFSSVALIFEQDISKAPRMRQIVADAIRKDSATWNEAILGRSRENYIETILKPSSWGGAIELAILSNHYSTEISSIDVETGRIDRFTPSSLAYSSGNRCIVIYSGIHYDAISLAPMLDAPADFHQTVFPILGEDENTDQTLRSAKDLVAKLRAKRAYTNTATFDLRCEVCQKGLKGEKEAREHAKETGHTAFGEY